MFLQPGEEAADDAGHGAVAAGLFLKAGEGLVDFLQPEHRGGDGLHQVQHFAKVLLRRAALLLQQIREVHPHQREAEEAGDRLGAEALAATLHTGEEDSLGVGDAARLGVDGEGLCPLLNPVLEAVEPADVADPFFEVEELQQVRSLHHVTFLGDKRGVDVVGDGLNPLQGAGEGFVCFVGGEAEDCLDEVLLLLRRRFERTFGTLRDRGVEFAPHLLDPRKRQFQRGDLLDQFDRTSSIGPISSSVLFSPTRRGSMSRSLRTTRGSSR